MKVLNEIIGTGWWDDIDCDVTRVYEAVKAKKDAEQRLLHGQAETAVERPKPR